MARRPAIPPTARPTGFEQAQRELFEAHELDVESRFVDLEASGGRVHAFEAGPSGDDPPLVFVHGTGAFGAFLTPLMAQFDSTRLIAFDRPGYGLSDPFTYASDSIGRTLVEVIEAVLDRLGVGRADLVGNSMGGHAAMRFALARPDRVRRLAVLGAPPAFPGTVPPLPIRLMTVPGLGRLIRWLQKSGEAGVLDVAEIFGEREAIQSHPPLIRAMAADGDDPKTTEAGRSEFSALTSIRGWRASNRIGTDVLEAIQPSTLLIWGERDPLGAPEDVRDGVGMLPNARFEPVDAGHLPFLGHPERCARLIRELRDRSN